MSDQQTRVIPVEKTRLLIEAGTSAVLGMACLSEDQRSVIELAVATGMLLVIDTPPEFNNQQNMLTIRGSAVQSIRSFVPPTASNEVSYATDHSFNQG